MSKNNCNRVAGLRVIELGELPDQVARYGFSVYRGVLVQWDVDRDPRILEFIDGLQENHRRRLVSAMEHEACLLLKWDGETPSEFGDGENIDVAGDVWCVFDYEVRGLRVGRYGLEE